MDRQQAIEQLPDTYASALLLRSRGFDDAAIAAALALEAEAASALLRVAEDKLAGLIAECKVTTEANRTQTTEVDRN